MISALLASIRPFATEKEEVFMPTTDAEFDMLAAQTGIPFTDKQKQEIKRAFPVIERFVALSSKPMARAVEPMMTVSVEPTV